MDKRKLKRYELAVYVLLITISVILGFIGDRITQETIKAITINLASELLAVGILFFLINRVFLLDADDSISTQILQKIDSIQSSLKKEFGNAQKLKERQEQKISVKLQNGARQLLDLPIELCRAELTRAEILGRIGMIPMAEKGKRFTLSYLSTPDFLRQIHQVVEGNGDDVLTIPCNEEEFKQFNLDVSTS